MAGASGSRYILSELDGNGGEQFLLWDLPLDDVKVTNTLSGPDAISATLKPEMLGLVDGLGRPIIRPWKSVIYAEQDGAIRAGCIVVDTKAKGSTLSIDAMGFAGYPADMPYLDEMVFANADPTAIVTHIYTYLQAQPGGNLGLVVNLPATPIRTGDVPPSASNQARDEETGRFVKDDQPKAVELSWKNTHDLGAKISELVKNTPFDYREVHTWTGDRTMRHELIGGYPNLGRVRDDLRFVVGENITPVPDAEQSGEEYASGVFLLGAGEGEAMLRAQAHRPDETRLRRIATISNRLLSTQADVDARAREEVALLHGDFEITSVVLVDHPHAPVGSYQLGDVILVQAGPEGWQGSYARWSRIVEITYAPEAPAVATLKLIVLDGQL